MDKILYKNKWLSLHEKDFNGYPYIYSHETRCNGHIIAVLPYRLKQNGDYEFLMISEVTPCWSEQPISGCITGGWENGKKLKEVTVKELFEEAGYKVTVDDIISLGTCRGTKSNDTIFHLYTVDLTDKDPHKANGNNEFGDYTRTNAWYESVLTSEDPITYTVYVKLLTYLLKK